MLSSFDGFEETKLVQMPTGRRQLSSRRAPGQTAPDDPQKLDNSIATEDDVRGASLPLEPVPPSEQLQPEDIVQAATPSPLELGAPSMATSPPRQTAPRLASLKSRKPPILSTDSTASEPLKPQLKFMPKSALRRSKEVRDAVERAEADRRQTRLAAEVTSTAAAGYRGGLQGRGGRGGGRGTGRSDSDRFAGGQASGHLSGSTIGDDGGRRQKVTRAGLRAAASEPSRSAARVKKGIIPKPEREGPHKISSGGPTQTRAFIKEEALGPAFASSDDEPDIAEGPRVNIEHINLISDDESVEEDPKEFNEDQGRLVGSDKKVPGLSLKPIRVDRHEHVERAIGGNMDLSSLTSAELRRRAQQREDVEDSLFISDDVSERGLANIAKGRSKAKDVEFVRDERRWKGVYQDEEGDAEPRIKEEPREDDSRMAVEHVEHVEHVTSLADRHSPVIREGIVTHDVATDIGRSAFTETNDLRASKPQQSKRPKVQKTVFQTEEDRQEWNRHEEELEFLREELGTTGLGLDHSAATLTATREGVNSITENLPDRKEGQVYLFQLPPIAPQLLTMAENASRLKAQAERENDATHTSHPPRTSASTKSRPDLEDRLSDKRATNALDVATTTNPPRTPGKVGTLRVYDSGRVKIEWGNAGGASMELRRGFRSSMLQEVIMTNFEQTAVKVEGGDGGGDGGGGEEEGGTTGTTMKLEGGSEKEKEKSKEQEKEKGEGEERMNVGDTAWAVGELAGSFVMTPDWDRMFK